MSCVDISFCFLEDPLSELISSRNSVVLTLTNSTVDLIGWVYFTQPTNSFLPLHNSSQTVRTRTFAENQMGTRAPKKQVAWQKTNSTFDDLHKDLTDFNLISDFSNSSLCCKMCDYVATRRFNLKTHYKLKHLGGADLVMQCQICDVSVKTKGTMKKHYMKKHNLKEMAAENMCSSG